MSWHKTRGDVYYVFMHKQIKFTQILYELSDKGLLYLQAIYRGVTRDQ